MRFAAALCGFALASCAAAGCVPATSPPAEVPTVEVPRPVEPKAPPEPKRPAEIAPESVEEAPPDAVEAPEDITDASDLLTAGRLISASSGGVPGGVVGGVPGGAVGGVPSGTNGPVMVAPDPAVTRPKRIGPMPNCQFPAEAQKAGIDDAKVILRLTIATNGKPTDVKVIRDPGHGLASAARACALAATYAPAEDEHGNRVEAMFTLAIRFKR